LNFIVERAEKNKKFWIRKILVYRN
jgi:hypothetical protein